MPHPDVRVTVFDATSGEPQQIGESITDDQGEHHPVPEATPLTFAEVSAANRERVERWHPAFPADAWTGADWSNAMAGEAGEAANVVKKLRRAELATHGAEDPPPAELLDLLADEIADTYTYLDLLAQFYGIDLPAAVVRKFNAVSEREGFPERLVGPAVTTTRIATETGEQVDVEDGQDVPSADAVELLVERELARAVDLTRDERRALAAAPDPTPRLSPETVAEIERWATDRRRQRNDDQRIAGDIAAGGRSCGWPQSTRGNGEPEIGACGPLGARWTAYETGTSAEEANAVAVCDRHTEAARAAGWRVAGHPHLTLPEDRSQADGRD